MITTPEPKKRGSQRSRRAAARLAAVQALYQVDLTAAEPAKVIAEFRQHRIDSDGGIKADRDFFGEIVEGVSARREEIDALLTRLLAEGWALPRLETVLRAILRAGAFELLARGDVPARVVIDEYVNVARAFFSDKEPGVVNGILDRLAHSLRAEEFEDQTRAAEDTTDR
ncbi:MAG TPA: transcription antitermination factor NusB [Alphaproteobacteria bacterium]|nr:transcription antitermination factor NusB [Alphaproteobacteria bacterium]